MDCEWAAVELELVTPLHSLAKPRSAPESRSGDPEVGVTRGHSVWGRWLATGSVGLGGLMSVCVVEGVRISGLWGLQGTEGGAWWRKAAGGPVCPFRLAGSRWWAGAVVWASGIWGPSPLGCPLPPRPWGGGWGDLMALG